MAYTERPNYAGESTVVRPVVEYHDRVRWGPIFAGIVTAIAVQLILSALGAAIGLSAGAEGANPRSVGLGVGIWSTISLLIALFIGSWVMANTCGPMNNKTAMLNGTILWATTLAISAWLLASGVSGTFGVVAANAGDVLNQVQQPGGAAIPANPNLPNVNAQEAQQYAANAAKAGWAFVIGSLLGLAAALIGATVGAHRPRSV